MAMAFQLRLRLHTPVILPRVVPRLDTLLTEAMRRLHLDWQTPVQDLPLVFDKEHGGYRGSQVVFGITPWQGLEAHPIKYISNVTSLPLGQARSARKSIKLDGGGTAPKLSQHTAYLSPYLLFYGEGDVQRCAELLSLLGGIGLEHARGQGHYTVETVIEDPKSRWKQRPWRTGHLHRGLGYTAVPDMLAMTVEGENESVHRPPRILKEVVR